jgi:3-phosphoshikimate 1-carboxyvinyltransferase
MKPGCGPPWPNPSSAASDFSKMDDPMASDSSLEIIPISHPLDAVVHVPGSKSLTNRALLVAALANGRTVLTNALLSDDSHYFVDSLQRLGFDVRLASEKSSITVNGLGGNIPAKKAELFVGNAGTAARFLTALLTLGEGEFLVNGDARMRERPIADLLEALTQLGAIVSSRTGCLPVRVSASGLPGGRASVAGNVSSQFLSGLLMVAPYTRSGVELVVEQGLNSRPYVDMTLAVMSDFGVGIERNGYDQFSIHQAHYRSQGTYGIESDASAASYFFAAPAILGGRVKVRDISSHSRQGDIAFLSVLEQMGCSITENPDGIVVSGPATLHGVDVDMRDISDTAQTLAAIAPFAATPTQIRGIGFIRAKETDRVRAVCTELARLGVDVEENPDGMVIRPCKNFRPDVVHTYNDHRMAMAFALIGLRSPRIRIENPACVSKTFPNYFDVLESLR